MLQTGISLARQCYAQYRQMAANNGSADIFSTRFKLIEDRLTRISNQPELIGRNKEAINRVADVLKDGASLVKKALGQGASSAFMKAVSTATRFLKAKTYGEQFTELSRELDSALGDLSVS